MLHGTKARSAPLSELNFGIPRYGTLFLLLFGDGDRIVWSHTPSAEPRTA